MSLVEQVYALTASFPADERFGLTGQLRRAAVSVPSNIAEGYGRGGGEYRRFVDIAYGSLCEVETQLELGARLGFARPESLTTARNLASEVGRMLNGLRKHLNPDSLKPEP